MPSGELGGLVGELAELAALSMAQIAAVVADAEARGVVEASQCANTAQWVAEYGWHLRRDAYTIAKAAKLLRRPELADAADSVLTADVDLGTAVVVAAEFDKLAPDLTDEAKPEVLAQLLDMGATFGPGAVRTLKQEILARWGEDGEFDKHQESAAGRSTCHPGRETSPGVHEYKLTTDNEGKCVLEAAIGPLSAPKVRQGLRRPAGRRTRHPHRRPAAGGSADRSLAPVCHRHRPGHRPAQCQPQGRADAHDGLRSVERPVRRRAGVGHTGRRCALGLRHHPQTGLRRGDHPRGAGCRRRDLEPGPGEAAVHD